LTYTAEKVFFQLIKSIWFPVAGRRKPMNKADLVEALRREQDLTRDKAEEVVTLFFKEMTDALVRGDRVEIRGLWSLYVREYGAYTGRNPRTGEYVEVQPKKLPFFKCGTELKKRVDYK
jgi:integration host factor subunit beta